MAVRQVRNNIEWREFKQLCSKLGTYPQDQQRLSQEFHETVAVRTAKTWDITRYGGVPVNLKETTATTIAFLQAEFVKNGVQVSPALTKLLSRPGCFDIRKRV